MIVPVIVPRHWAPPDGVSARIELTTLADPASTLSAPPPATVPRVRVLAANVELAIDAVPP